MATLLFFGQLSDIVQNQDISLPIDVSDTDSLLVWLSGKHEGFLELMQKQGTRIAVNKLIITESVPISDLDEITFMSAFSGG